MQNNVLTYVYQLCLFVDVQFSLVLRKKGVCDDWIIRSELSDLSQNIWWSEYA